MRNRKPTLVLMAVFAVAAVLAAVAGVRTAPSSELLDQRRSTYLNGPSGASGFAQTMQALGVAVERRRRSLFDLSADSGDMGPTIALLDVVTPPTRVEQVRLTEYVSRGGSLVLSGRNGVESCFGVSIDVLRDSVPLAADDSLALPWAGATIEVIQEPAEEVDTSMEGRISCMSPPPETVDTFLVTVAGDVVAWKLDFVGGGSVMMLGDSRFLSNEVLKETDAGRVILPWLMEHARDSVIVDEYHHGFGDGGSILMAAARWTLSSPAGWVLLQLVFVSLLALAVGGVRFGSAKRVVERRRRSALEHLDALAVGLHRARGHEAAARLIVGGLQRRLAARGLVHPSAGDEHQRLLESLALAARTDEAKSCVERLGAHVESPSGSDRVLSIATTVEDVWEALKPVSKSARS